MCKEKTKRAYVQRCKQTAPVSSEISDFTPCAHAQTDILHRKHADKTDY